MAARSPASARKSARFCLTPELAESLQAEVGSPALKITRRYFDAAGDVFEISRSIHPANRFTFCMEMNRAKDPL